MPPHKHIFILQNISIVITEAFEKIMAEEIGITGRIQIYKVNPAVL